jgi:phospholipid/cholesterol/gamma-HCH transport system ATP-binding protein
VSPPPLPDPHVALRDVCLRFGRREVFRGLGASFERGTISVLLGGSGSGKSTLLRLVGGLIRPDSGSILVAGTEVVGCAARTLQSVRQKLGMMFQGGALLDSLSIYDNLALPLRERTRLREPEVTERVGRQLAAVGLEGTERLLPGQLSGGMIKRAALARALIASPEILLCDEPFSGLDPVTVYRIEALLVELNRSRGMTLVVASHHIPSTLRMADRLLMLLDGGGISGTPAELVASGDERVREFLDEDMAALPARPLAAGGAS